MNFFRMKCEKIFRHQLPKSLNSDHISLRLIWIRKQQKLFCCFERMIYERMIYIFTTHRTGCKIFRCRLKLDTWFLKTCALLIRPTAYKGYDNNDNLAAISCIFLKILSLLLILWCEKITFKIMPGKYICIW